MTPNDTLEHGTYNAHKNGPCACAPCRRAGRLYQTQWRLGRMHGEVRRVPVLGSRRRILALGYMGWRLTDLAAEFGWASAKQVLEVRDANQWVTPRTAKLVADVYERLCMTHGPGGSRTRNAAVARGAYPPLAWDDIDNPREQPKGIPTAPRPDLEVPPEIDELQQAGDLDALRAYHRAYKLGDRAPMTMAGTRAYRRTLARRRREQERGAA